MHALVSRDTPTTPLPYRQRTTGRVAANRAAVFAYLDDHARLAQHMEKPNWRMGWGRMTIASDAAQGRAVGSRLCVSGRVFGVALAVEEVVEVREPPVRKVWATLGEPRLLVIGPYRMRFELTEMAQEVPVTELVVEIEYAFPERRGSRLLAHVLAQPYATWCTTRMVEDARKALGGA